MRRVRARDLSAPSRRRIAGSFFHPRLQRSRLHSADGRAKFPHKFGAVWTANEQARHYDVDWDWPRNPATPCPDSHAELRFEERPQPGVDRNYTYHVDRGKFDLMLLQHAKNSAPPSTKACASPASISRSELPSIKYHLGRKEMAMNVRMVVDASGRQTLLGNQLKLKIPGSGLRPVRHPHLVRRFRPPRASPNRTEHGDYIYIHFLPISNSWMWQIPITGRCHQHRRSHPEEELRRVEAGPRKVLLELRRHPSQAPRSFAEARSACSNFKEEGDYSYSMKQLCGDRFMLIGDAGRFVDPIFSTGVSIALNSSRFAHRDILGALERNDFSRASFQTFEDTIRARHQELVRLHHRLLPAERAVHLLHHRSALPAGRSEAAAGRRLRRRDASRARQR